MAKKKRHPRDKMKLKKKGKYWWIVNVPEGWYHEEHDPEFGPYETRAEAQDDLDGLSRFALDNPDLL
jgi:hypothetical protein